MTQHRVLGVVRFSAGAAGREYMLAGLSDAWLADVCALERLVRVIAHPTAETLVIEGLGRRRTLTLSSRFGRSGTTMSSRPRCATSRETRRSVDCVDPPPRCASTLAAPRLMFDRARNPLRMSSMAPRQDTSPPGPSSPPDPRAQAEAAALAAGASTPAPIAVVDTRRPGD